MKTNNVFIATLPRSGSTLVGMMLGANSQICHIGESAYWSKINVHTTRCCCGIIGCQTLLKISRGLACFPSEIEAIHIACGTIDLREEPNKILHSLSLSASVTNYSNNFESLIQKCCCGLDKVADIARSVSNKDIIVENSKYLSIAETLLSSSERWKVLVVIRDPRGIASCGKEAGERKNVPRPIKDKVDLCLSFAERAVSLARHDKVLLVRYEDICRNTVETLDAVCSFVGVPFEARMLKFKEYKWHLLMGNHMMHGTDQEIVEDLTWRQKLSTEEKGLFTREDIVRAYARLGYDLTVD